MLIHWPLLTTRLHSSFTNNLHSHFTSYTWQSISCYTVYLCKMFSCRWSISLWEAPPVHNPSPGHQRKGSFGRVGCKDELQEPFHRRPSWIPTFDSWQRLWRGLPPRVIRSKSSEWPQRKWSDSFLNKLLEHSFFPKDQFDTKQV